MPLTAQLQSQAAAWDQAGSLASPAHPASCHVYPAVTEVILCFPKGIGYDTAVGRSELNVCELIVSCSKELWGLFLCSHSQNQPSALGEEGYYGHTS